MQLDILRDCFAEDPETMLDAIGIDYRRKGKRLEILCPFHNDVHYGSCLIRPNGFFNCFSCGAKGDLLQLTEQALNVDFPEAVIVSAKAYGLTLTLEKESDEEKKLFLSKEEKEALDFPSTALGLGKVMRNDPDVYRKIVLSRAAQMIARYQKLDRLYGSRDADEAYVFGEFCEDANAKTFSSIHHVLSKKIGVLHNLEQRL